MLLRLYEAALQLRAAKGRKTAVVIIDELGWFRFEVQLWKNWINWENPAFVGNEEHWRPLLHLLEDASDLPGGLGPTIRELDSVEVFRQNHAFEFRSKITVALR